MADQAFVIMSDGPMDGRGKTNIHAVVVASDYDAACEAAEKAGFKIDNRRYYFHTHDLLRAA